MSTLFPHTPTRQRIRIRGSVQGVGFRPFLYGLAEKCGLSGWVLNDGEGILLEIQGQDLSAFHSTLKDQAPALSQIVDIETHSIDPIVGETQFQIHNSQNSYVLTDIIPDAAACADCLAEMSDPNDRRYGYAFINCTHCGPRYTITKSLPYDRAQTSMASFQMCDQCAAEYNDPHDRRFHAQPTCCPDCGPHLSTFIEDMASRILQGQILAIKGLGGFHLVCDAHDASTIKRLRELKNRDAKPFAVMVAKSRNVPHVAHMNDHERTLLESHQRPIVLLKKKECYFPEEIAPGLDRIGVMLPYTPIHHLLLDALNNQPLVMTSANPGGEPLVIGNDEAEERLGDIADLIISHDRDILIRVDDSVLRSDEGQTTFMRRARGFTPAPIPLKNDVPNILALGAFLKNTVCVTRGKNAYLSQHIGDLDNVATLHFFEETITHMLDILRSTPDVVVHDLHPDFPSTRIAASFGVRTIGVQHHHAHIASVMAEHNLEGPVIGLALDGFGLGDSGGNWGGELLKVDGPAFERLGHLKPLAQPGADKAARQPWRMGASALHQLGRADEIETRFHDFEGVNTLRLMLEKQLNSPMTSSAGRLFDAACGLLGVCPISDYEGQAPMMLESLVRETEVNPVGWMIEDDQLNLLPLLASLCERDAESGANLFHGTLIAALADWVLQTCETQKINTVALSGGCFLNQVLSQGLISKLQQGGITPYLNQQAPLSDGGLSLGQAWIAAQILKRES